MLHILLVFYIDSIYRSRSTGIYVYHGKMLMMSRNYIEILILYYTKVWTVLVSWALCFNGVYIFPKVSHTQETRRKTLTP